MNTLDSPGLGDSGYNWNGACADLGGLVSGIVDSGENQPMLSARGWRDDRFVEARPLVVSSQISTDRVELQALVRGLLCPEDEERCSGAVQRDEVSRGVQDPSGAASSGPLRELQQLPVPAGWPVLPVSSGYPVPGFHPPRVRPFLYKTELCRSVTDDRVGCNYNSNCRYAHRIEELFLKEVNSNFRSLPCNQVKETLSELSSMRAVDFWEAPPRIQRERLEGMAYKAFSRLGMPLEEQKVREVADCALQALNQASWEDRREQMLAVARIMCGFGTRCKFRHPREALIEGRGERGARFATVVPATLLRGQLSVRLGDGQEYPVFYESDAGW